MGGGHPIKKIAIPLMIINRPMIATPFFIEHSSSDLSAFKHQTKIQEENLFYYKKRSQKRKEKCLDFC
jgi:hypothetical protein